MHLPSQDQQPQNERDQHSTGAVIPPVESEPRTRLPRWRRRLRWWLAAGVAVLLLAFLPPLINANRYQREIARSMSLSLGRPVHLDNVTFHLLPTPGLTLSNLVVSEDPAFGAEPTIRANSVEASLRLSSLWRRRVEFSTVRFVEPSVNLVRNASGRWNLANVLLHAAQVTTAPTSQRRAGPAPRFPYIEATGGRVNVKLGDEKLPFSLTAADFALWQPSPHQWRVRLRGQPDRTDANTTDPGSLRIEGDLLQATAAAEVRVDLHATWYDAPLGEATLLVTGSDMGWRGHLNLDASLTGTLDAAEVSSKLTLGGLRRAEFAPAHPLDLQLTCSAGVSIETVVLREVACRLPDSAPEPMTLTSPEVNLQHLEQTDATLVARAVPNRWAMLWAALFSPRVSSDSTAPGTLDLQFTRSGVSSSTGGLAPDDHAGHIPSVHTAAGPHSAWSGSITETLQTPLEAAGAVHESGTPVVLLFRSAFDESIPATSSGGRLLFRLEPTTVPVGASSSLEVRAFLSTAGYSFGVTGMPSKEIVAASVHLLPELGDGLDTVLAPAEQLEDVGGVATVDFVCEADWGSGQVCAAPTGTAKKKAELGPTGSVPRSEAPAKVRTP